MISYALVGFRMKPVTLPKVMANIPVYGQTWKQLTMHYNALILS